MKRLGTLLLAFGLFAATLWIVFDDLFAPLGEQGISVEIPNACGQNADALKLPDRISPKLTYRHDANTPTGTVIAQSPSAGTYRKLAAGETCELLLTVSLGEEHVTLPDTILGRDAREVQAELRALGLTVKTQTAQSAYEAGTVFAVEPRAGSEIPIGTTVLLSVSEGQTTESVSVPELRGLSRSDALIRLWMSKLVLGEVIETDSDLPAGTVIAQSRMPDTWVTAGTKIDLYISRASAP